jgi:hypothetical protein
MAIPTSGTISISTIRNEHGNTSGQDGLNEYYRKGTNSKPVPNNGKNNNIPTSGSIDFADFYGSVGGFATLASVPMTGFEGKLVNTDLFSMWTGAQVQVNMGITNSILISGNRANSYWKQAAFNGAWVRPSNATREYLTAGNQTRWTFTSVQSGAFGSPGVSTQQVYIYDYLT